MLNSNGERMLAYTEKVTDITPIEKADRLEAIHINGWVCVCGKGEFHIGDIGVFFEIDSKLPEVFPFTEMQFVADKKYKIKSQKIRGQISQGLFMPISAFTDDEGNMPPWASGINYRIGLGENVLHEDLTSVIGVTYAVPEDNRRKANTLTAKQKMEKKYPRIFSLSFVKWMTTKKLGMKILKSLFAEKEKNSGWPEWVKKTDEERVQNIPEILQDKEMWIATEKIDGTSMTATLKKTGKRKYDFYVCSRNVVFDRDNQKCYYETNVYTEIAERYNFESVLLDIANKNNLEWVTLQGEIYGNGIQKRSYGLDGFDFAGFNLIFSDKGRLSSLYSRNLMKDYNIPWVPIVDNAFFLPDTVDEMLLLADGKSEIDGGMREGLVLRSTDGQKSFKAVSNEYLLAKK